jgi:aspartyl-tRNA synthetase
VIGVRGKVRDRGKMRNPKMPTGAVEVVALEAVVFNEALPPIFPIEDEIDTSASSTATSICVVRVSRRT